MAGFIRSSGAVALMLVAMLAASGCASSATPPSPQPGGTKPSTGAVIEASPNPVPSGGGLGKTTVTWRTGDGSRGQVYVSEDGGSENLFAEGTEGSDEAPWIRAGASYEFRLYAGTDRRTRLGSVKVTRAA